MMENEQFMLGGEIGAGSVRCVAARHGIPALECTAACDIDAGTPLSWELVVCNSPERQRAVKKQAGSQ